MIVERIWGQCQREWGYEVRVDYTDTDGSMHHQVISFKTEPTSIEITNEIDAFKQRIAASKQELLQGIEVVNEGGSITKF